MQCLIILLVALAATPAWADISCSAVANGTSSNTADQTSYTTSSVTLPANTLILLHVVSTVSSGTPNTPTATSTGATWAEENTRTWNTSQLARTAVLRTMVAEATSGAITIDYASQTQLRAVWTVIACSGVNTSGTSGSGAIQTTNNAAASTGTGSATHTFTTFTSSNNRPVIFFATNNSSTGTLEAGWTQLTNQAPGTEAFTQTAGWKTAADDTTFTYTRTGTWNWAAHGVELKPARGGGIIGNKCCASPFR